MPRNHSIPFPSLRRDSNSGPQPYHGRALPLELRRHVLPGTRCPSGARTPNLRYQRPSLCRLSYRASHPRTPGRQRRWPSLQGCPPGAGGLEPPRATTLLRAPERFRTDDLLITSQALFRLSYRGMRTGCRDRGWGHRQEEPPPPRPACARPDLNRDVPRGTPAPQAGVSAISPRAHYLRAPTQI